MNRKSTALIPYVSVPQPPFCFLWWCPVGLRSGSWGHCLASELRTRAASPPLGWAARTRPPLNSHDAIVPYESSGGPTGWGQFLQPLPTPPPKSSLPAALQRPDTMYPGEEQSEPIPRRSRLQHQFSAAPREAGKISWE